MNSCLVLGYLGTVIYLGNHTYVSLSSRYSDRLYFSGNLIAAFCVAGSSLALWSWQAVVTNLFWALVSIQRLRGGNFHSGWVKAAALRPLFGIATVALVLALLLRPEAAIAVMGWISVASFVIAYVLFAADQLPKQAYLWLNAAAALLIIPQLWVDKNMPVLVLEVAWAILSVYGALMRRPHAHVVD